MGGGDLSRDTLSRIDTHEGSREQGKESLPTLMCGGLEGLGIFFGVPQAYSKQSITASASASGWERGKFIAWMGYRGGVLVHLVFLFPCSSTHNDVYYYEMT